MTPMTTADHFVAHEKPAWRERSTSVIRASVPNPPDGAKWYEQVWARRLDEHRYELCCIPFTTYDYALGDIVEVGPGGSSKYLIRKILEPSGRAVLRVWLADASRETWDELLAMLRSRQLLFEFREPALVAIDVPSAGDLAGIEAKLREMENAGRLRYERGS